MSWRMTLAACAVALVAGAGTARADQPADDVNAPAMTLGFDGTADTQPVHWFGRGCGYGGYYGGYGGYGGYYGGYGGYYGGYASYYGGCRPSYGYSYGYSYQPYVYQSYYPSYAYYGGYCAPSYSYCRPYYGGYGCYGGFYYGCADSGAQAPALTADLPLVAPAQPNGQSGQLVVPQAQPPAGAPAAAQPNAPAQDQTDGGFRYDGGPANPVPMPSSPNASPVRQPQAAPRQSGDLLVMLPLSEGPADAGLAYPAYGETTTPRPAAARPEAPSGFAFPAYGEAGGSGFAAQR